MKKKLLFLIAIAILTCTILCACSQWDTPYGELNENGNNVSVKFVSNGGMFAGTNGVSVIDVFNYDNAKTDTNGNKYVSLISPDDKKRGNNAFEVSRTGYFLAGWYVAEEKEVNGVVTYDIGKMWNFSQDKLTLSADKEYDANEPAMILCAVWIPYFTYEFYAQNSDGDFVKYDEEKAISIELPSWNERTGKLDMKKYPTIEGKTFEKAYFDEALTEEITDTVTGSIDYENGISLTPTIKIYTTWLDGDWYKINTANQLYKNATLNGNYILTADIDFADEIWPSAFSNGIFKGKIHGNGHKISNVNVVQSNVRTLEYGGIFGRIGSTCEIKDVIFENVSYTVKGTLAGGASYFGLLTGSILDGATISNVSVKEGTLYVSPTLYEDDMIYSKIENFSIGLICGDYNNYGIGYDDVECKFSEEDVENAFITITNDKITVTKTA